MKKLLVVILAILLVSGLILSGCSEPAAETPAAPATTPAAPATTPAAPSAPAAPAAPAVEPVELIFNHQMAEVAPLTQCYINWGKMLEEESGGQVTFTHYYSGSFVAEADLIPAMLGGVVDVSYHGMYAEYYPLMGFIDLPFLGLPSMRGAADIFLQLYETFPEIQEEFGDFEIFAVKFMPPTQLHMRDNLVTDPAQLDGLKIYLPVGADETAEIVKMAGGVPVDLAIQDIYTSLERGLVVGAIDHFPVLDVFGCTPLIPYHTTFGEGGINMAGQVSLFSPSGWAKLPDDVKKLVRDTEDALVDDILAMDEGYIGMIIEKATAEGATIHNVTPEEYAAWDALAAPLRDEKLAEYFAQMESLGKPGHEVYDETMRLIAAYSQ